MRLAALYTAIYAVVAVAGPLLFRVMEVVRGEPDPHRNVAVLLWFLLLLAAWAWTVAAIFRSRCR